MKPYILSIKALQNDHFWKPFQNKKLFGLIGNPVSKSISHLTHNNFFKKIEFPGYFFRIHLEETELPLALSYLYDRGFAGLAVTMPFKEKVVPFLKSYPSMGSVNTLLAKEDGYHGANTDTLAIEKLLLPFFLTSPHVSLFGAGGTAKAAAHVLQKHQVPFTLYNRTLNKNVCGIEPTPLKDFFSPEGKPHIVINTTSVGMSPDADACPIDTNRLSRETVVFDAIYNPLKTKLLFAAEERGLTTISGIEMFTAQALFQFRLFLPISFEEKCISDIFIACQKSSF